MSPAKSNNYVIVGYAQLGHSGKSIKLIFASNHYYIRISEVKKILKRPGYCAQIVRVRARPIEDKTVREPHVLLL